MAFDEPAELDDDEAAGVAAGVELPDDPDESAEPLDPPELEPLPDPPSADLPFADDFAVDRESFR